MGPSAGTGLRIQNTDIFGAVAQERECLLVDRGENQLSLFAVGEDFTGLGIDDLRDEVVFIDVHAVLAGTLKSHAGTGDLGESVDVISLDPELVLDVMAHFLGPGFCAENTGFELDLVAHAALSDRLGKIGSIRRRAAQDSGAQICHKLELAVGIAGRHGERQGSELVRAAVEARTACEKAVAVTDLHNIISGGSCRRQGSCTASLPHIDIILCIAGNDPPAGRTARGMNADAVRKRNSKESVGILSAEILLAQERQLVKILYALNILRLGNRFVDALHGFDKTLILPRSDLLPRSALNLWFKIVLHRVYLLK